MIIHASLNNFNMLTSKLSLDESMHIYDKNKFFNLFIKDMIGKSFTTEHLSQMFFVLCTELAEWNALLSDQYLKYLQNPDKKPNKKVNKEFISFPMSRIVIKKQSFDINGPFSLSKDCFNENDIKKLKEKMSIYANKSSDKKNDIIYVLFNGKQKLIIDNEEEYKKIINSKDFTGDINNYVCFYGKRKKILFFTAESEHLDFLNKIKLQVKSAIDSDLFILYNGVDLNVQALFPIIQKQICSGLAALNEITPDNKFAFDLIGKKNRQLILNKIDQLDVDFSMSFSNKDVNLKLMQNRLFNNCNLFLSQLRIASKFIIGKSLHELFTDIDSGKKIVGANENLYTKCLSYYAFEANKLIREAEFFKNRIFRKYLINQYKIFLYAQDICENNEPIYLDLFEKKIESIKYNTLELLNITEDYKKMFDFESDDMLNMKVYYFNSKEEADRAYNNQKMPWFLPCSEERLTSYKFICCYQYMFNGYNDIIKMNNKDQKISEPFYMLESNKWGIIIVDKKSKGILDYIYSKFKNGGGMLSHYSMFLFDLPPLRHHDEQGVVNLYQNTVSKPYKEDEQDSIGIDFDINEEDKMEENKILMYILSEYGFSRETITKALNDPERLNGLITQIINNSDAFSVKSFNKIISQIKDKKIKNINPLIDLLNKTQDNIMKLRHANKIEFSNLFKEYLPYTLFFVEFSKKMNKNLQNTKLSIDKSTLKYSIIKEIKQIVENNLINYTEQHIADSN